MRIVDDIPAELDRALRDAVAAAVGSVGGAVADIWRDVDHHGDDCIFVDVAYTRPDIPIDPTAIVSLQRVAREAAQSVGERAVVYVHDSFRKDQKIDEAAMARLLGSGPHRGGP